MQVIAVLCLKTHRLLPSSVVGIMSIIFLDKMVLSNLSQSLSPCLTPRGHVLCVVGWELSLFTWEFIKKLAFQLLVSMTWKPLWSRRLDLQLFRMGKRVHGRTAKLRTILRPLPVTARTYSYYTHVYVWHILLDWAKKNSRSQEILCRVLFWLIIIF